MIDIGTGDGQFVYESARLNPQTFYIGLDANARPLEKISEKIYRKPAKGGVANALFVQASVEDLPHELDGVATEVHVQFPWGSLLKYMSSGDIDVLRGVRRICAQGAVLELLVALDPERDRSEISRLGLDSLSLELIDRELRWSYRAAGFEITSRGILPESEWRLLRSSWSRRLRTNRERRLIRIRAKAL